MAEETRALDLSFDAPIGIDIKGDIWSCVEVPGSAELLGTRKAVRVDATVDGIPLTNVGLMVTGRVRSPEPSGDRAAS